jgi:hypothetical protein
VKVFVGQVSGEGLFILANVWGFRILDRDAIGSGCSLTREEAGKFVVHIPMNGSVMTSSGEPLACRFFTYFQRLNSQIAVVAHGSGKFQASV